MKQGMVVCCVLAMVVSACAITPSAQYTDYDSTTTSSRGGIPFDISPETTLGRVALVTFVVGTALYIVLAGALTPTNIHAPPGYLPPS